MQKNIRRPSPDEQELDNIIKRIVIDDIKNDADKSILQKLKEIAKQKALDKLRKY